MFEPVILASHKDPASSCMINYLLEHESFIPDKSHFFNIVTENYNQLPHEMNKYEIPKFKSYHSERNNNVRLLIFEQSLLDLPSLDIIIPNKSILIFLSKHVSTKGIPAITSHFTGNFGSNNLFGGRPFEIGMAYPTFQKFYMKRLGKYLDDLEEFDLTIEASHHGPTSSLNPIIFVEIGSTEKEWKDEVLASIVCKSVLSTIKEFDKSNSFESSKIAIGLGGNHYPQKFNDLIINNDVAFAAIASKYNLQSIEIKMLEQMKTKSVEPVTELYMDKKIRVSERQRLVQIAELLELHVHLV